MPPKPPRLNLTGLTHEDKDRLIDTLFARVDTVEAKLGMNSEDSSKPPSSDGLAKKQKTTSLRGKPDKAVGGQQSQKGSMLKGGAESTSTQDHRTPSHYNRCHSALPFEEAHVRLTRQLATKILVLHQRLAGAQGHTNVTLLACVPACTIR